jgi:hypothetical protein
MNKAVSNQRLAVSDQHEAVEGRREFKPMMFLKFLPLLAPLPEGYAVGMAIWKYLDWHPAIVGVAALIVAGTGFYGVQVANRMSEFNTTLFQDERKQNLQVPTAKAWGVLAVWFIGVVALTIFLETVPMLRTLTPLGLVVVGFAASYLFSLSNILDEHVQLRDQQRIGKSKQIAKEREEKKAERKERQQQAQAMQSLKQAMVQKMSAVQGVQGRRRSTRAEKLPREILLMEWARDPYLTPTEMVGVLKSGHKISVTREAIRQKREAMMREGILALGADGAVVQLLLNSAVEADETP